MKHLLAGAALLLLAAAPAAAQHEHGQGSRTPDGCEGDTGLNCATAATPAFAPDGTLLLAWTAGGRVSVARSTDLGQSFAAPVTLAAEAAPVDDNGDGRPTLAAGGTWVVAGYTVRRDQAYNGTVMVARSTDGGRSFGAPRALDATGPSQRFQSLSVDPDGSLLAAWIDKRRLAEAKARGQAYAGAAVMVARSTDGGASFTASRVLQDGSCECCRIAVGFAGPGRPVLMWRNLFPGSERDHAIATFEGPGRPGEVHRVSEDHWKLDACPHHGPALAVAPSGRYHAAWFTDGTARQGLFYARSIDGGRSFSVPRPLGDADEQPSHPQLLAAGGSLWLAWKQFDGERTRILVQHSTDDGATWRGPVAMAETADASDHPQLVARGAAAFLSWVTRRDGWRLIPLAESP